MMLSELKSIIFLYGILIFFRKMFDKYLLFALFFFVIACGSGNNQPKVEVGLTENSIAEKPIEKSTLVESVPELNKVETLSDVDGRNDLLDNFWVKLPNGLVSIRLSEEKNRGCIIKTNPDNNFSWNRRSPTSYSKRGVGTRIMREAELHRIFAHESEDKSLAS